MKTTEKDILMICKGCYNKEKYKTIEEALDAYYRREYLVPKEDLPRLSHRMMINLWFEQCIKTFLIPEKINEFCHFILATESWQEKPYLNEKPVTEFYDVMYYRCIQWLKLIRVKDEKGNWIIDLSDYDGPVI